MTRRNGFIFSHSSPRHKLTSCACLGFAFGLLCLIEVFPVSGQSTPAPDTVGYDEGISRNAQQMLAEASCEDNSISLILFILSGVGPRAAPDNSLHVHALQRTAPCVTAPASAAAFPPTTQVPRCTPRSLSLGSLGAERTFSHSNTFGRHGDGREPKTANKRNKQKHEITNRNSISIHSGTDTAAASRSRDREESV